MRKNQINRPMPAGKVARVPVVIQMEVLECGAACLDMILAYYGRWVPLEKMRVDCGVSRNGTNLKNVVAAARSYGLEAECYRTEPENLEKGGTFPCIVHWNFNHFIVVDGFTKDGVIINDPANGRRKISRTEFDEGFTGVCVLLEPKEDFQPGGEQKSVLRFAKSRLSDAMAAVLFVLLTSVLSQLINFINPAFSRILLDYLMPGKDPEWVVPFLFAFGGFALLQIILSAVSALNTYRIEGQMEIIGSTSFMWKLFRLPIEFFSLRMSGDIQMRLSSNANVSTQLVHTAGPLVLDVFMMLFYLVVMIRYNALLAMIGVISVLAHFVVNHYTLKLSVNINRSVTQKAGKLSGIETAAFSMIESIQASGAENGYFEKWAGYHASLTAERYKRYTTVRYLNMLPSIVSGLSGILILGIAVAMAIRGHFTLGMIMAFQSLLGSFTAPAQSLISSGGTVQEMRTEMERIEDVMCYEDDPDFSNEQYDSSQSYEKLRGEVELKNVYFGYSRLGEPLIRDFNVHIAPGSRVAFVGPSGCGKSTLTKLITGLFQPWSGEILLDGKKRSELSRSVTTGSVAVVTQDVYLYEDTIENNIRMFDTSISEEAVLRAAKDAQIHDEILIKEGGYQHVLLENGNDLSGGQKQRIEIARALAQDPSVIVLDEATSALDAKTEYDVIRAIVARGITCIMIAHRLSTIRDCDEILVLDNGVVTERGTHAELMAKKGFYEKLIRSE